MPMPWYWHYYQNKDKPFQRLILILMYTDNPCMSLFASAAIII